MYIESITISNFRTFREARIELSHSDRKPTRALPTPIVVGSLEWMNIILMAPGPKQTSRPKRIKESIHGLDADQILLTNFFGMRSTRASVKESQLQKLTEKAREGDVTSAKELLRELSKGME